MTKRQTFRERTAPYFRQRMRLAWTDRDGTTREEIIHPAEFEVFWMVDGKRAQVVQVERMPDAEM